MFYQIKNIPDSVKDVDSQSRKVKVAISQVGSKDYDNDVIDPGAYTKTLAERGPSGKNLIWHLTDHNPSLKSAIGKFSELKMEGDYLVGITTIPNTSWGNDVLEFYKTGHINQHSIGFRTIQSEPVKGEYNLIKEVMLYEGSAVLWGANPNTPTLEAGKSMTKADAESEIKRVNDEMTLISKSLKDGRYTDEGFELIEVRFKQLQERINQLLTYLTPAEVSQEPKDQKAALKQAIEFLTIKHKLS
jgi:HK97 family phage prohead protease